MVYNVKSIAVFVPLLHKPQVVEMSGISQATLYRYIRKQTNAPGNNS